MIGMAVAALTTVALIAKLKNEFLASGGAARRWALACR